MEQIDEGFFYKLGVDSNLKGVNRDIKTFIGGLTKLGVGITGLVIGSKVFGDTFRDINALSKKTGENARFIRQIGNEFRVLGYEAGQGFDLVNSLSEQLKEFRNLGTGDVAELARIGIDVSSIDDVNEFIDALRQAYSSNADLFTTIAPKLGLNLAQIDYITQQQKDFEENRALAREQVKNTQKSIDEQKKLNKSLSEVRASIDQLGQDVLSLITELKPAIEFVGENLKEIAIGLVALKGIQVAGATKSAVGSLVKGGVAGGLGILGLSGLFALSSPKIGRKGAELLDKTAFGQNLGEFLFNLTSDKTVPPSSVNNSSASSSSVQKTINNTINFNMIDREGANAELESLNQLLGYD